MACREYNPKSAVMSFFKFKDVICCLGCNSIDVKGMAMLKCMHFVCTNNHENEELTCLGKLLTKPSGPGEAKQTEDSSGTSPNLIQCGLCKMTSDAGDIETNKAYTQEVLELYRDVTSAWGDGEMIQIQCEACGEQQLSLRHLQGFPGMRVCTHCNPNAFVCYNCTPHDIEMPHHFENYKYDRDEWDALHNALRTIPLYLMNLPTAGDTGTAGTQEPQGADRATFRLKHRPPEHPETRELLSMIDITIELEHTFKTSLDTTLGKAKKCCNAMSFRHTMGRYHRTTNMETQEARYVKLKELISKQTEFGTFILRTIIHNKILKLLIHVYPKKLEVWRAIRDQFSVLTMIENSGIPMTTICRNDCTKDSDWTRHEKDCSAVYMIPFSIKVGSRYHSQCNEGMFEAITAPVQNLGTLPTIQISIVKLDSKNNFREIFKVKEHYDYKEILDVNSSGLIEAMILGETNALRCVQVASRLYACSSHEAVEIIRINRNEVTIRERYKLSEDGEMFGESLWFDDGRLYALLVGSKTLVRWHFTNDHFVVIKEKIHLPASPYDFTPTDSVVGDPAVYPTQCVCFDLQHPSRVQAGSSSIKRQFIGLSRNKVKPDRLRRLEDSPILERPVIVGNQIGYKLTLIERTQEGNNLVIQSEDRSWFKVRFQFDQQPPLLVTDAWLSKSRPYFLYVIYQLPGSPQVDVAAAAATHGAQKVRKIRITLDEGITHVLFNKKFS